MTSPRLLFPAALTAALLATAAGASAAEAPVVSAQRVHTGATAPVSVPGTGLRRGDRIPRGARIIYRSVTLEGDQTARFTLRATGGRTLQGLGVREGDEVGFAVVRPRNYVGRRQVRLRSFGAPRAEGEITGRIYALTR